MDQQVRAILARRKAEDKRAAEARRKAAAERKSLAVAMRKMGGK